MSGEGHALAALLAELRRKVKAAGAGGDVAMASSQAHVLAEEVARLVQSSERLRKQNAKLRRRIARLKAGQPDIEQIEQDDEG